MVTIEKSTVQVRLTNKYYKTIINAKLKDQTTQTLKELGEFQEDEWSYEYELSHEILVLLWK